MLKCDVRHLVVGLSLLLASREATAQDTTTRATPSVFTSDSPMEMTIRTDIRALLRDRGRARTSRCSRIPRTVFSPFRTTSTGPA
jgi:hypothetical protein